VFEILQVETIRAVLKKEIGLPIVEVSDKSAKLHGSDILFTGTAYVTINYIKYIFYTKSIEIMVSLL
jgi:hypothetical protein